MVHLRILSPDDWRVWRRLRLKALCDSPQAYGSTLADWKGPGDTKARWQNRLSSMALNGVAELDGTAVGMV